MPTDILQPGIYLTAFDEDSDKSRIVGTILIDRLSTSMWQTSS
jgi:hypothetical protein